MTKIFLRELREMFKNKLFILLLVVGVSAVSLFVFKVYTAGSVASEAGEEMVKNVEITTDNKEQAVGMVDNSGKAVIKNDIQNEGKKKNKKNENDKDDENKRDKEVEIVKGKEVVKGEILVKYKSSSSKFAQENKDIALEGNGEVKVKNSIDNAKISVVKIGENETIESIMAKLKQDPDVEYVEPNYLYEVYDINSNDTDNDKLWGLHNSGQVIYGTEGTEDADIDFPEAMEIYNNNGSPIVAVIDTGVMYDHPDLQDNMVSGNGQDFANGDGDAYPKLGDSHGTHVAGTIAATYSNGEGITGVSPDAKIMALNACRYDDCKPGAIGYLSTAAIVESIGYAADNGARVINASFGGGGQSTSIYDAIEYFGTKGGLFIAAAGNGGTDQIGDDNDTAPQYPASYDLDNIIAIAATDNRDGLAIFSNYGIDSVDVGAPGVGIYSTVIEASHNWEEILDEEFEEGLSQYVQVPADSWRVLDDSYGDMALRGGHLNNEGNYLPNENVVITSGQQSLEGKDKAVMAMLLECDTGDAMPWEDYLALEISRDGVNFEEVDRFNERILGGVGEIDPRMSSYINYEHKLTPEYFTDTFKFRFRWVSDGNHSENQGCNIDYVVLAGDEVTTSPGYAYYNGTSMAAPHVAGLAGLLWSQKPELTYSEVKDIILTTGDDITALNNKTVTGKRINAFNALDSLMVPVLFEVTSILTPTNNVTPQYTFNSTKAGEITYEGGCSSTASSVAVEGDNVITFDALAEGVYSDCKIIVTDEYGNISNELLVSEFTIDTTAPVIPTVISQLTNNVLPVISGSASSLDTLTVELNGIVYVEGDGNLVDNGDNTWSLSIPVGSELPEGSQGVVLTLSDAAGNVAMNITVNEIIIDITIPVIILNGDSAISLNAGDVYLEQGATCTDTVDGDCIVVIGGDVVDTNSAGTYVVTYNAVDIAGNNADEITRIVTVNPDAIAPAIELVGNAVVNLAVGSFYLEQGATCTDNVDSNCVVVVGGDVVDTTTPGMYVVTYNAVDTSGNNADEIIRTVNVTDQNIPVITLVGDDVIDLTIGDSYTELGATAIDNVDGDISASIIIGGDIVDTTTPGTYVVTYNISDSNGNEAIEVIRTVNVNPDVTAPVIELNGSTEISLMIGDVYTEQGATCTDNVDSDCVVVVGGDAVDTTTPGTYVVTYNAVDIAGNNADEITRTVIVAPDTIIPVIILNGEAVINLIVGDAYVEPNARAVDNVDGDLTAEIVIGGDTVDVNVIGTYIVTYNVSDAAGNKADEVTRTVNVSPAPDTLAPVIELTGEAVINLAFEDIYTEQGATCTDNVDSDCTVVIGGDVVNTSNPGTYIITYNAVDTAGNNADEITRTVIVANSTFPMITLIGEAIIELLVGETYEEQGATAIDEIDGDISDKIVIGGDTVDVDTPGTYVVTYNVTDSDGEDAREVIRTVVVKEGKDEEDDNDDDKKSEKKTELERPKKPSVKCYDDYAKIKWGDRSHGEDGYKIRRRVMGTKEWTKITATDHEKEYSYKDRESLKPGVTYEWKIRAYRKSKRGEWSRKISCTMPVPKVVVKRVEVKGANIEQVKVEDKKEIQEEVVEINEDEMKPKKGWMRGLVDKVMELVR